MRGRSSRARVSCECTCRFSAELASERRGDRPRQDEPRHSRSLGAPRARAARRSPPARGVLAFSPAVHPASDRRQGRAHDRPHDVAVVACVCAWLERRRWRPWISGRGIELRGVTPGTCSLFRSCGLCRCPAAPRRGHRWSSVGAHRAPARTTTTSSRRSRVRA
jgi:hypothetical protein